MNYKKSYILLQICLYTSLLLCMICLMTEISWIGIVGFVVFAVGLVQSMVFYHCPYCGTPLNIRGRKPQYCPECGKALDD